MGAFQSSIPLTEEEKKLWEEEQVINAEIDKKTIEDKKKYKVVKKLLLLGAGESGKSTVFKQIRCLHGSGYTIEQLMRFVPIIHRNILSNMKNLIDCAKTDSHFFIRPANKKSQNFIIRVDESEEITPEIARHLHILWNDTGIKNVWENRSKFQIEDSCPYFFGKIEQIGSNDYRPTPQDLFWLRIRTTGILEMKFCIKNQHFLMVDVGGQRNERKKWIHCFDNVDAVIFVAAINEYDQVLYEDESINRMMEALLLFKETVNSKWFKVVPVILFFNKSDLLNEKISKVPLSTLFPEYMGGDNFQDAVKYIKARFLELDKHFDPSREIYSHITCATNTDNIKHVFLSVRDSVISSNLRSSGII